MTMTTEEGTGGPRIRLARPDDLPDLLVVEQVCFDQPNTRLLTRVCGKTGGLYVADTRHNTDRDTGTEAAAAGYVFVGPEDADRARVVSLAVLPSHRRRGIATGLMRHALDELRGRGFSSVELEVRVSNGPALSLYEGMGFRRVGVKSGYYGDGEDAYLMEKRLLS